MSTYLKIKLTIKTGSVCPKVCDGIEIKLIDNKIKNKIKKKEREMPITELLERNAREFPKDIALVEINPDIQEKEG